jgi:hypothetical protein
MWSDIYVTTQKRLKAKQFTNEGKMCLFQSSLRNKALKTTELKQKRNNHQPHSARERPRGSDKFCTPKISGAQNYNHMCQKLAQMAPHHHMKYIALLRPDT